MTATVGQHAHGQGDRVRAQVTAKIEEIDAKMEQLGLIREQLTRIAAFRCRQRCPVVVGVLTGSPAKGKGD